MVRTLSLLVALAAALVAGRAQAAISGDYVESRTCDVYTGPCFANAQMGLAGHQAVLAWSIDEGSYAGVDLSGLKAVMAVRASNTLSFGGGLDINPYPIQAVILLDERASTAQREALERFVRDQTSHMAPDVQRVDVAAIEMRVDHISMSASLRAGDEVHLSTRKLKKGDCVCSNEELYYPPLVAVENADAAYTLDGGFSGRGLRTTWSNPGSRSAYLATFNLP
ncbi:MAG: DUF1326 domain-containing protein [Pirellulales bacterium]|nr:DUF1326 domain-containing protein [Pirellulales bacterium]